MPVRAQAGRAAQPRWGPRPAIALLHDAQPYLLDAATLAPSTGFRDQGAVELYHLRYEQVMPNGLSALVVQRIFAVRDSQAANLFALDNLWYDTARNRFQLLRARVLRTGPDGAIQELAGADQGDFHPGATGSQRRRVGLPVLRAGDRVEVVYALLPDSSHDWSLLDGHFLGNLFAFRDSFAEAHVRYVLASTGPLVINQFGLKPARRDRTAQGLATWQWDAQDLQPFFSQPDGPSITDESPFVQASGFHSWAAMANWYSGLLAGRARMAAPFEQKLVQVALPTGRPANAPLSLEETRATVARVWRYLAPRLNYRGNESGIHAYVPAPVAQVFNAGSGDCKDGALLLATWLRAAGVEADLALVRTPVMGRLAPPASDGAVAATMAAFDHALVYVPATNQWIDTTAPSFLDNELPSSDQNSLALIVRAGQSQLVRIPAASAEANFTSRTVRMWPESGHWLRVEGEVEVRGADAPDFRQRYGAPGGRVAAMTDWLRSYFPTAQIGSVAVEGVDPSADTVHLRFTAHIAQEHGFTVSWIRRGYSSILAAQAEREQVLELPLRWQTDETWSLALPGGDSACAAYTPDAPVDRQGEFGQLMVHASCAQGWLTVNSSVMQTAQTVTPADYGQFRAFWQAADAALNAPLLTPEQQQRARQAALDVTGKRDTLAATVSLRVK